MNCCRCGGRIPRHTLCNRCRKARPPNPRSPNLNFGFAMRALQYLSKSQLREIQFEAARLRASIIEARAVMKEGGDSRPVEEEPGAPYTV